VKTVLCLYNVSWRLADSRWKVGLLIVIVVATIVGGLFGLAGRESLCPQGSVLHPPASTCIDPRALYVTGPYEEVTAVASEFGGWANHRQDGSRMVLLPIKDLDELDRLKEALEEAGFKGQYVPAYSLQ